MGEKEYHSIGCSRRRMRNEKDGHTGRRKRKRSFQEEDKRGHRLAPRKRGIATRVKMMIICEWCSARNLMFRDVEGGGEACRAGFLGYP